MCLTIHLYFLRVVIRVIEPGAMGRITFAFPHGGYLGYLCSKCVKK